MKITEDKYIEILEIQGISYNKNSKWFTVSLERINEAINYKHCSTELVCEKCDGFGYIEEVNEFRTYLCDCQENKTIT
jgi:hypothetical protein